MFRAGVLPVTPRSLSFGLKLINVSHKTRLSMASVQPYIHTHTHTHPGAQTSFSSPLSPSDLLQLQPGTGTPAKHKPTLSRTIFINFIGFFKTRSQLEVIPNRVGRIDHRVLNYIFTLLSCRQFVMSALMMVSHNIYIKV